MEQWKGKIAVVTGASAGIGAAIVKDLAELGVVVVGLARRVKKVEEIKSGLGACGKNVHAIECDISNEDSVRNAFNLIEKNIGLVNILINNAGLTNVTPLLKDDDNNDDIRQIINTNVLGLMYATRQAYKQLKKSNDYGYIINISSVLGHTVPCFPGVSPPYNIYPGSKHAVRATSEVLRQELNYLKLDKIRISTVSPGGVDTEFAEVGGVDTKTFKFPTLKASDVSNAVLYVLSTPPTVQVQDLIIKPKLEMI